MAAVIQGRMPKLLPDDDFCCMVCRQKMKSGERAMMSISWDGKAPVPTVHLMHKQCAALGGHVTPYAEKMFSDAELAEFWRGLAMSKNRNGELPETVREVWRLLAVALCLFYKHGERS